MTKYIIMKLSRAFEKPTAEWAYRGPTCAEAGVTPGRVYDDKIEAESDAKKLTRHNPVGFVVLEMNNADMCV